MMKWYIPIALGVLLTSTYSHPVPEITDDIIAPNSFSAEIDDINIGDQKAAILELLKKQTRRAERLRKHSEYYKLEHRAPDADRLQSSEVNLENDTSEKSLADLLANLAKLTENIRRSRRQLDIDNMETNEITTKASSAQNDTVVDEKKDDEVQEEEFDDDDNGGAGNGLIGLIGSLSGGGNGMSDAGALFSALAGLLTNLLGENGIDVNAAIGSSTGLLGGLLMRPNENIGATFARYITTGVEGFTGGGARQNGQFFGTFLGRIFSQLSAGGTSDDPTAGPPDSGAFFSSLISSFLGASAGGGNGNAGDQAGGGSGILAILQPLLGGVVQVKGNVFDKVLQKIASLSS